MHFVAQVQKNSAIVEQVVYAIAGAQIIKEPVEGGGKMERFRIGSSVWEGSCF